MIYQKVLIFLICITGLHCKQFHEFLDPEERKDFFQSDTVPEYEVVPITHPVKKRSVESDYSVVYLKVFGESLTLYLSPADGVLLGKNTKVWQAYSDNSGNTTYKIVSKFQNVNFQLYQDVSNMAAVTVNKNDYGEFRMEGTIGPNYVVKAVPEGASSKNLTQFPNQYNEGNGNATLHVVYKNPDTNYNEVDKSIRRKRESSDSETPQTNVKIVYPEILIYMDSQLFSKFERNVEKAKQYIATFWNAVDLRYRQLDNPKIRLNIAGIILPGDMKDAPFIERNFRDKNIVDAANVLVDIGKHLYVNKNFIFRKDYDLFIAMTSRDMCNYESNSYDCSTMGLAYVAAACSIIKSPLMVEGVGMFEDNGGFKGVIPAVHEVGHLLGVRHDKEYNGNLSCVYSEGYIMNIKLSFSRNGLSWSPCSKENFTKFLNKPSSECLRNKPNLVDAMHPLLPGLSESLEMQCQRFREGSEPCNRDKSVCLALSCTAEKPAHVKFQVCETVAPAAEGSPCGDDSICFNGKCISKKEPANLNPSNENDKENNNINNNYDDNSYDNNINEDDNYNNNANNGYSNVNNGHPSINNGYPSVNNGYPTVNNGYPSVNNGYPSVNNGYPSVNNGYPSVNNGYPSANNGYPSVNNGYPSVNNGYLSVNNGYRSVNNGYPILNNGYRTVNNGYPSVNNGYPNVINRRYYMYNVRPNSIANEVTSQ